MADPWTASHLCSRATFMQLRNSRVHVGIPAAAGLLGPRSRGGGAERSLRDALLPLSPRFRRRGMLVGACSPVAAAYHAARAE
jgi:hypothetical protein